MRWTALLGDIVGDFQMRHRSDSLGAAENADKTTPDTASVANEAIPRVPGRIANWPVYLALVLILAVIDQLSKVAAVAALAPPPAGAGKSITIWPKVIYLRYAENTGAAFSFMSGRTGLLSIISILAAIGMFWWWYRIPAEEKWGRTALAMIIAGAIGNLIDRVRLGYVVDFFDTYIFGYDYPVFNIADSLICIGVGILLIRTWKGRV